MFFGASQFVQDSRTWYVSLIASKPPSTPVHLHRGRVCKSHTGARVNEPVVAGSRGSVMSSLTVSSTVTKPRSLGYADVLYNDYAVDVSGEISRKTTGTPFLGRAVTVNLYSGL
jgi:hypothetical protein